MKNWWKRRSLKLRLTLWYAAAATVISIALAIFVYEVVEHRLGAELDRQLRIDFDVLEAQLETDAEGQIKWAVRGAHGDEGFARLAAWFEVWSENGQLLLRHWPVRDAEIKKSLLAPAEAALHFYTVELEKDLHVRLMERPARVRARSVMIRVFRDESDLRLTLHQIVEVFLLGFPLAVALSALGGYLIAGKSLSPVKAMAAQARKVTSESLSERLPNPNPHDELGQLAAVVNETLQRLEHSFSELKRFTGDASHDLRTPLTALRTVGEVGLRQSENTTALRETIGSMLEEAQRLNELIESLLELARMESGKVSIKLEPVKIAELAGEVRDNLSVLAAERRQAIELAGDDGVAAKADRILLRQALMNIVHNAVRYAPPQTNIAIRTTERNSQAIIEVADQGPGIASEHQQKIFERFYRVDKSRSRSDGGHGLGLAIAKWSVEHQGGRIELESRIGRGSVFRILLPRWQSTN